MAMFRTKVSGPSVVYEATKRSDKIGDGSVFHFIFFQSYQRNTVQSETNGIDTNNGNYNDWQFQIYKVANNTKLTMLTYLTTLCFNMEEIVSCVWDTLQFHLQLS